jgi:tripartite-type tricarboxylate transporter receptor subunit TctC
VNSASPYRTINDLFDAARTRRSELTLAASGPASPFQIGFETLRHAANIDMTFVPYPGGAPVANALLGNHVTSAFTTFLTVAEQIKAGKVRALAVPSRSRTRELPEVPTLLEAGYGDLEVDIWYGLAAPARTAQRSLAELSTWFAAAMQSPEVTAKLMVQGLNPAVVCGAEFEALIQKQYDEYGRVIRESNIKAE